MHKLTIFSVVLAIKAYVIKIQKKKNLSRSFSRDTLSKNCVKAISGPTSLSDISFSLVGFHTLSRLKTIVYELMELGSMIMHKKVTLHC